MVSFFNENLIKYKKISMYNFKIMLIHSSCTCHHRIIRICYRVNGKIIKSYAIYLFISIKSLKMTSCYKFENHFIPIFL